MLGLGLGLGLIRQRAVFSPLQLSGLQLFLDPSDTSTLFQDAAGTTPVTSAGDPVGLALDKSQGLRRGAELVTNGAFDTDLSGWVDRSTGSGTATWTASGVEIARVDVGNNGHLTQDVNVIPGEWYTFTAARVSGSGAAFRLGSTTAGNELYDAILSEGTTPVTVRATTSVISVGLRGALNGTTTVVEDISMRHLPGNHLTAPSDAARPVYQTGGGLHWLEFDGVDDELIGGGLLPFSTEIFNCTAFRLDAYNSSFPHIISNRGSGAGETNRHPLVNAHLSNSTALSVGWGESIGVTHPFSVDGVPLVLTSSVNGAAREQNTNGHITTRTGPVLTDGGTEPFKISGGNRFAGRFYGTVQVNAVLSASQIASIRQWFAQRSGGIA